MTLLKSWVTSANDPKHPFPLNNLPYGVFSTATLDPRCGVAIGDMILDMAAAEEAGLISLAETPLFDVPFWNEVMEEGSALWSALRARLIDILAEGSADQPAAAGRSCRRLHRDRRTRLLLAVLQQLRGSPRSSPA